MEVIRERAGRVSAGKHVTRPVTVRYRTVPILAPEWRARLLDAAGYAALAALIVLTGLVEESA